MKIATWNIERLKHKNRLCEIERTCDGLQADILVLTETDERVTLSNYPFSVFTPTPSDVYLPKFAKPLHYLPTEHRVAIYSKFPIVRLYPTFDEHTAICAEVETTHGSLLIYGTIMGIWGNRQPSYIADLEQQIKDFQQLSSIGNLCICGDFNCSFSDNYYFTNRGRELMRGAFHENNLHILTEHLPNCIDHIAVSKDFISCNDAKNHEWNLDKSLSDHKGVMVEF